jgi:hypothetical protein
MNEIRGVRVRLGLRAIGVIVALTLAVPAVARADRKDVIVIKKDQQYKKDQHYKKNHHHSHHGPKTRVIVVPEHRGKVREYFVVHRRDLPRYYYTIKPLPPGIERHLVVDGHLPPGLDKRYIHPFPRNLEVIVGPPPPGTRRIIIGHNAYLIEDRTGTILDILSGIL